MNKITKNHNLVGQEPRKLFIEKLASIYKNHATVKNPILLIIVGHTLTIVEPATLAHASNISKTLVPPIAKYLRKHSNITYMYMYMYFFHVHCSLLSILKPVGVDTGHCPINLVNVR